MINTFILHVLYVLTFVTVKSTFGFTISREYHTSHHVLRQTEQSEEFDWSTLSAPTTDELDSSRKGSQTMIEDDSGNVHIPPGGYSVSDDLDREQRDRFETKLVPVKNLPGVAQLVTSGINSGSFEPVRYLVALERPTNSTLPAGSEEKKKTIQFTMVDIPPYSKKLEQEIRSFMGENGQLAAILMTNRDSIHYDSDASIYSVRRSDLNVWASCFPDIEIVSYRLDTPRDCRESVTQCLDGYGPFALTETDGTMAFNESGRPLTYTEWDGDVVQDILKGKPAPDDSADFDLEDEEYSPASIRLREEGKRCLAVCTPGHTFGSVSFVFPETRVCCPGFTIPVEDTRQEDDINLQGTGPALDCRGYITTSRAGIVKQMESARKLIYQYVDRFDVVLPARGDPLFLDPDVESRKKLLLDIVDDYDKIGKVYEELGIFN